MLGIELELAPSKVNKYLYPVLLLKIGHSPRMFLGFGACQHPASAPNVTEGNFVLSRPRRSGWDF